MNDDKTLTFTRQVDAPPAQVYFAFTNPVGLREWLADRVVSDPVEGGRLYAWWRNGYYAAGKFQALDTDKKVVFTWQGEGEPAPTKVKVLIEDQEGRTQITIKHKGVGEGEAWEKAAKNFTQGWENGLKNLQAVLETGLDPRFYDHPLLGVYVADEIDEYLAAKLGVPVNSGIVLSGVIDGMGAESAGLQKGDVLYSMDGAALSYESIKTVIGVHKADDEVKVVYFRGAEKRTADMVLSRRPAPNVPPTPAGLAEMVGKLYLKFNAKLDGLMEGVGEKEADHKTAPEEWSVKEVLAHLIAGERYTQDWIGSLLIGKELSVYSGTQEERLQAMVKGYGSLDVITAGLRSAQAETAALLEMLPAELAARKSTYIRLGSGVLDETAKHLLDHLDQIQEAVTAARRGVDQQILRYRKRC